MPAELYAHVPGLKLEQDEVPFAGGRLLRLSFEDWSALESEFAYAERKYGKTAPVFWIRDLETGAEIDQESLVRAAYEAVQGMHTAFLLDTRMPLIPTPLLSCLYILLGPSSESPAMTERPVMRLIGPMEREFIVYGSPMPYTYDAGHLASLDALYRYVEASGDHATSGDIAAAIEVLEETARPDSWYAGDALSSRMHDFVRCMAASEGLLLPPEEERTAGEITQSFGRHAAVLFSHVHDDRDHAAKRYAALYRFRSELMHGRAVPDTDDERLREGRALLRNSVCAALIVRNALPQGEPLWRLLQAAWEDADAQRGLAAILTAGRD